jgi:hypothetical protein
MYYKTKRDLTSTGLGWAKHGEFTVPAGTRCKVITRGTTAGDFFVDEFGFIPKEMCILLHDAVYYGIIVPKNEIVEEN